MLQARGGAGGVAPTMEGWGAKEPGGMGPGGGPSGIEGAGAGATAAMLAMCRYWGGASGLGRERGC